MPHPSRPTRLPLIHAVLRQSYQVHGLLPAKRPCTILGIYNPQEVSTLARLLANQRGKRHLELLLSLSIAEILDWAHIHFMRTGKRSTATTSPIPEGARRNLAGMA